MAKNVTIFTARDEMQAEFLVQVLESHEIEASVAGAAMATLAGYLPATYGRPAVVVDEHDVERAQPIVDAFERRLRAPEIADDPAESWICTNCGESIEPQFTDCWKCQTPRAIGERESDTEAKARAAAERVEADPDIAVDLPCVRCEYNLRHLPVDQLCPECAHPIFASLLQTMQSQQEWSLEHERQLAPCLDFIERRTGYPVEAIAFVTKMWRRAAALATGGMTEATPFDDDVADALRELAGEFLGDPVTAGRALQRWHLASGADVRRIRQVIEAFQLFDDTAES